MASQTDRVLCPETIIATRSGIPALTMLPTAVRLKSWNILSFLLPQFKLSLTPASKSDENFRMLQEN
jgi:hypothetical protein